MQMKGRRLGTLLPPYTHDTFRSVARAIAGLVLSRFPISRLVEVENGEGAPIGTVTFQSDGKRMQISRLGTRSSKYRRVYRVVSGRGTSRVFTVEWHPEGVGRFEVHGQSLAAFSHSGAKVAELEIVSNVPSTTSLLEDEDGNLYPRIRMVGEAADARLSLRRSNFLIADRNVGDENAGWKSWQHKIRLNYLLDAPKSAKGKRNLIVIFSSLGRDYDFTYNYRSSLRDMNAYRLFLLDDFGKRGSYYFADHRDTTIYNEVQKFLSEIIADLGVSLDRVVFGGSSKGGTAALLHGTPLGVGKIVVGAPQVYPGNYLHGAAPAVLQFIAGGQDAIAREWLNDAIISRICNPPKGTAVRILVGAKDHHLKRHVEPLMRVTSSHDSDIVATVIPDLDHGNIGSVYRHYLKNIAARKPSAPSEHVIPYKFSDSTGSSDQLAIRVWKPKGEQIACHLYQGNTIVARKGYSKRSDFTFSVAQGGEFRVKVFRRRAGETRPFAWFYTTVVQI